MEKPDLSPIKQISILEVATRLGIEIKGKKAICFGGHDTDPSLSFVPAKNIWKCFGCGKNGDSMTLVMEILQCDFTGALNWFIQEFGVAMQTVQHTRRSGSKNIQRKRSGYTLLTQNKPSASDENYRADPQVYTWLVEKCGEVVDVKGVEYLRRHGIPLQVANRFGVRELRSPSRALTRLVEEWGAARVFHSGLAWGEAYPNKLIWGSYALLFPFLQNGEVVYIQGRSFSEKTKFLGLRGIPKPLFNASSLASLTIGTCIHLCEGIPDALALEAKGLHSLAVLGASSFRPEWVDLLLHYDVVVVPDGDSGGETFMRMVNEAFRNRGKAIRRVRMPKGKDAADLLGELGGDI